ncbi:DUF3141 domain-containing protein [Desulfoluna butyratoxydans]|uniref:Alpha/beta hydrolase fold n=1 Tax=Desulfoluna butyratoxydans TaxID=231438 RepID=A0A4U8YS95_9BACT|nr:DUF3141 domain-containing protein [Desulfoluna butyratoxydans]VFQ44702.1 alpha/beta hydrolase fold [Desulfoluna butyratoxydans]
MDAAAVNTVSSAFDFFAHASEYAIDTSQRSILFWDVLRKRGNNYLEHLDKGQPPVLIFDYEIICDARTFDRPANYALALIRGKRSPEGRGFTGGADRRVRGDGKEGDRSEPDRRPIVIIDPRAGHGPGIGGSKEASEIGHALSNGHSVYFVLFFTEPMEGQTLGDVKNAEIRFLEEVARRHPDALRPVVIGNCQGGWATAIVAAERPDLAGPIVLNGAPLSYWSGVGGTNPMRYKGGLLGGVWINDLVSDLGGGHFDGANLVMSMEGLNPGNTFWSKQYNLYKNVDTEEQRFLDFEKWWGGFFLMTKEEIHTIVADLFIGNRLANGQLQLDDGPVVNLKRFSDPVVVFASSGDNITPPQQALNWIPMVYKSVDEIKRLGQVIVYIVHPTIGHLGIFVASSIAGKEQKEIIGSVEMINFLAPGLYEMEIVEAPSEEWLNDYKVKFTERTIDDILAYDDGVEDEKAFELVASISERNSAMYSTWVSPLVRAMVNPLFVEWMLEMHPMRLQRSLITDGNPLVRPVKDAAEYVRRTRRPVSETNPFVQAERALSDMVVTALDWGQSLSDMTQEKVFHLMYDNPVLAWLYGMDRGPTPEEAKATRASEARERKEDRLKWLSMVEEGGYPEGAVRMIIAMASVDGSVDEAEMAMGSRIVKASWRLKRLSNRELHKIAKEQARILQTDFSKALDALPLLLPDKKDREKALKLAHHIALADHDINKKEANLLARMKQILGLSA